jgi:hypothetical protein
LDDEENVEEEEEEEEDENAGAPGSTPPKEFTVSFVFCKFPSVYVDQETLGKY